jgi:hypothetical protein
MTHRSSDESVTLDTLIQWHTEKCDVCQASIHGKPKGLGQRSSMCKEYFEIIAEFSQFEAQANAIRPTVNADKFDEDFGRYTRGF